MRHMNSSFWEAMQPTADAIEHDAAHAVCLDFFDDLGSVHCGKQAAGPPPSPLPPAPPPPAPPPPAPVGPPLGSFEFAADWGSGGPSTTLPAIGYAVRKVEFIYYEPDGHTYAYADIVPFNDTNYPESFGSEVGLCLWQRSVELHGCFLDA